MIPRYSLPEMTNLFTDEARYGAWLEVEILATEAWAELGVVPAAAARAVRERGGFDVAAIEAREAITEHDVAAFVDVVQDRVGQPEGAWVHYGLTSSDVVDTALALQLSRAADLLIEAAVELDATITTQAHEYRDTPMVGRTHGIQAEPTTFGVKLALWALQVRRDVERLRRAREGISVGKLSGAVGTYSNVDPFVEQYVCEHLDLTPVPATQVLARDRHAELLYACASVGASIEQFATEIRHLQRTEVREVEEPFRAGKQKGSSAMPHKRNPVKSEQLSGLARVLRGNLGAGLENIALWHERDISHSSVERVILPDTFIALDHMLRRFTRIVSGLVVHQDRMLENLGRSRGVVFSGQVLLELAAHGVSREQAYSWVQRNALRSFDEKLDFKTLLLADSDITGVLSRDEIDRAFDLTVQLRHVDAIFERVFQEVAA